MSSRVAVGVASGDGAVLLVSDLAVAVEEGEAEALAVVEVSGVDGGEPGEPGVVEEAVVADDDAELAHDVDEFGRFDADAAQGGGGDESGAAVFADRKSVV